MSNYPKASSGIQISIPMLDSCMLIHQAATLMDFVALLSERLTCYRQIPLWYLHDSLISAGRSSDSTPGSELLALRQSPATCGENMGHYPKLVYIYEGSNVDWWIERLAVWHDRCMQRCCTNRFALHLTLTHEQDPKILDLFHLGLHRTPNRKVAIHLGGSLLSL